MHSQQPLGVVQNWSTLRCSKHDNEQCGYDHAPVTRGRMRTQFPLPHAPPPPQGASGQQLVGGVVGVQNRGVAPPPGVKNQPTSLHHTHNHRSRDTKSPQSSDCGSEVQVGHTVQQHKAPTGRSTPLCCTNTR